ncbi:MAG: response regulator [Candidatus Omnitrophica bacterium]|nr:response regulator [Candidatus Omnitrophota bacterium]
MAKKILICDDEPDLAQVVAMSLKAKGYEVLLAVDGVQSISVAHRQQPDLILLDIKMPAGDGYTVYKNLKKSANTMLIPIMFFSALSADQLKEKAEEMGAVDYITKPYEADDLFLKVRKVLGEAG